MKRRKSDEDERTRLAVDLRDIAVVTLLRDADRPLRVAELAERLVDREATIVDSSTYERELERIRISLHHNHLPRLADDGVVEYDCEENVATCRDDASVDAEWFDEGRFDELLARSRTGSGADENAVGVIEGRESIAEHGRRLADEADEELFCVYVSADLLEAECIRRAEDAIERDVDIYLGSQNPDVLDLTRERLPEVTLWERQLDWLNPPSRSPKVGRLVLADREKLMLALLDDSGSDAPSETAMIGDGRGNPLVALVRELLGPRLDHLDYQSTDFRSNPRF